MNYYGQFSPPMDQVLRERYFPGVDTGFAVDVGAFHSTCHSNSKHFEEEGWEGILIEPIPEQAEELEQNRRWPVQCCAVGARSGRAKFSIYDMNGVKGACSSLYPDPVLVEQHRHLITATSTIEVPVRTLDAILRSVPLLQSADVSLVSIDVEGDELSVLSGLNLKHWRPQVLCVENNHDQPELRDYLRRRGYVQDIRHGVNDVFVRK